MNQAPIYLVCYDIADNKIRLKVAQLLIKWGYERFQKSIFTGLQHPADNGRLWLQLQQLLKKQENQTDKLVVMNISKPNFRNMKILGDTDIDIAYILGEKHTEYL